MVVVGGCLDWMIMEVFSNVADVRLDGKYNFSQWVVSRWSGLPGEVIEFLSLQVFKGHWMLL